MKLSHRVFGNELVTIGLTGPDDIVEDLLAYFSPWLSSTETDRAPDVNISIVQVDAGRWLADLGVAEMPRRRFPRILNENASNEYFVEYITVMDRVIYRYPESGTCVTGRAEQFDVVGSTESLFWDTKELIQSHLLRPLMLRSSGMLHSASVVIDGRAWVICGDKGAGKTTLQHHLASAGAEFMSTDRTYIHCEAGAVRAVGHPGRMRIVVDDLSNGRLSGLSAPLLMEGPRKTIVPVAEVARFLGTGIVAQAPVGAIVILARHQAEAAVMESVRWDHEALLPHWLDVKDPMVSDWLMPADLRIAADHRQKLVDECLVLGMDSTPLLALEPAAAVDALRELVPS